MFQQFDVTTQPENGPKRLKLLRDVMKTAGVHGFLVPRSDAHQGENVAPRDERLEWLTGFTGSAGTCAVTGTTAALFVDSRYTLQAAAQVDTDHFTQKKHPQDKLGDWLSETLSKDQTLAYDPWLQTKGEIDGLDKHLKTLGITLSPVDNLIDQIWTDQPSPPQGPVVAHPAQLAGKTHDEKRGEIGKSLADDNIDAAVLTLPDSIAWLLNIRGSDIERTPVALAFAVIHQDAKVDLFIDPAKLRPTLPEHLGADVTPHHPDQFPHFLKGLKGRVLVDKNSAPIAVSDSLTAANIVWQRDPCILPKAQKTPAELDGARAAQSRDALAMIEFLSWLDQEAPAQTLTEIDVAQKLEGFRRATNALKDISFETISGAGPNGAIVHYRVNTDTNRRVKQGELLLVDSGGQYVDGTTDITRTVAIGTPPPSAIRAFTAVLKGMIGISRARFPKGLAGRDIDAFARDALWQAGLDYDHGTGHGVGAYLGVHEGPASISRRSHEPLLPGMILSNEPGYYEEGAFGIRIENLVVVEPAQIPDGGTREMLSFETLTYVPIDRRLIDLDALNSGERSWLDAYHAQCWERSSGGVSDSAKRWLKTATQPL